MLRTIFHPATASGHPHPECERETTLSYGPIALTLRIIRDGLCEGLAAQRRYRQLTSSGVAHDPALRAALGCDAIESRHRSTCLGARRHGLD